MATRTIKPQREDTMLSDYESLPDVAPSVERKGPALASQISLFIGFFLLLVGGLAIIVPRVGGSYFVSAGWGYFVVTLGLGLLLMHCYLDTDAILRRMYAIGALGMVVAAAAIRIFAPDGVFLSLGLPLLLVALLFLIGVTRVETDTRWNKMLRNTLAGVGGVLIFCGLAFGMRSIEFLTTEGVALLLFGLAYVVAYIGVNSESESAFWAGLTLVAVGVLALLIAIVRSYQQADYLVPAGLFLGAIGVVYLVVAGLAASDRPIFVMTRRELASFFYSPIAYLVLFGLVVIFGFNFLVFIDEINKSAARGPLIEPIIQRYLLGFFTFVTAIIMVPVLTMRTFSEERRTGSLEMLMTAPVTEWSIVLSKFFATFLFSMLAWMPFFLFAISFRIFGQAEYDYRPVLSFFLAVLVTQAGFVSIGLFVSSLTSNQIVSSVVMFAVMLLLIGLYWVGQMEAAVSYKDLIDYVSYVELWVSASYGLLPVRSFAFHLSLAAFFLYLTYLNLTARKWK
jgi:ABC-2 type transport system permease protein